MAFCRDRFCAIEAPAANALTLVDAEARIGLPAAASSSESTVESKPKPVSAYATDIEKAIAGFRAAHAMLAERENGASTNGEAR
jgi:hypothetical protein